MQMMKSWQLDKIIFLSQSFLKFYFISKVYFKQQKYF